MNKPLAALIAGLALSAAVTGCKKHDAAPPTPASSAAASAPSVATLDAALAKNAQLSTVTAALKDVGLSGVLAGKASYTLFAPTNAAFDALGAKGQALRAPEQRAALAAVLREHIVPGLLTRGDLDKALDRSAGKPVKLRSMGKGTLSLSRAGGSVIVTGSDGAQATLTSETAAARNGSALGIDRVLKKLD